MKVTKVTSSQNNLNKYFDCIKNKRVRSNTAYGKIGILCDADH